MIPNFDLIPSSKELMDARTFGYYVREQIDAYGTTMPEWMVESLVEGASVRTESCIDFLLWQVGLSDSMNWEVLEMALEAITVRDMDLEMFSEFLKDLHGNPLDDSGESSL
jgi:hypothetical protein